MSPSKFGLLSAVVLIAGCVPVTEPVGDAAKSEVDAALVGTWKMPGEGKDELKIDTMEVKGNPKGLMRMGGSEGGKDKAIWFFVATVGKEKYGNLCLDVDTDDKGGLFDFSKEGEFEKWSKGKARGYFVFRYTVAKDEMTINVGDEKAFKDVAEAAKFPRRKDLFFETPADWLTKYLEKEGHKTIFPATKDEKMKRVK